MPSNTKRSSQAHRVVCSCQARGCCRGKYLDAQGDVQYGVEVLRQTRDAHILLDRRSQAQAQINSPASPPHQNTPPLIPTKDLRNTGNPISSLKDLQISMSSSSSRDQQSSQSNPETVQAAAWHRLSSSSMSQSFPVSNSGDDTVENQETESSDSQSQNGSPIRSQRLVASSFLKRTCPAAILSRVAGVQEYDCGKRLKAWLQSHYQEQHLTLTFQKNCLILVSNLSIRSCFKWLLQQQ